MYLVWIIFRMLAIRQLCVEDFNLQPNGNELCPFEVIMDKAWATFGSGIACASVVLMVVPRRRFLFNCGLCRNLWQDISCDKMMIECACGVYVENDFATLSSVCIGEGACRLSSKSLARLWMISPLMKCWAAFPLVGKTLQQSRHCFLLQLSVCEAAIAPIAFTALAGRLEWDLMLYIVCQYRMHVLVGWLNSKCWNRKHVHSFSKSRCGSVHGYLRSLAFELTSTRHHDLATGSPRKSPDWDESGWIISLVSWRRHGLANARTCGCDKLLKGWYMAWRREMVYIGRTTSLISREWSQTRINNSSPELHFGMAEWHVARDLVLWHRMCSIVRCELRTGRSRSTSPTQSVEAVNRTCLEAGSSGTITLDTTRELLFAARLFCMSRKISEIQSCLINTTVSLAFVMIFSDFPNLESERPWIGSNPVSTKSPLCSLTSPRLNYGAFYWDDLLYQSQDLYIVSDAVAQYSCWTKQAESSITCPERLYDKK